MRQGIRALGWTITISTLILFAFLATVVYSVFQTALMEQGIRFGELQPHFADNTFILSTPVTVNNTGFYDMTDFNITTRLSTFNGSTLTRGTTTIAEIGRSSAELRSHNLSLSLASLFSYSYLLFNDSEFRLDVSIGFRYAYAMAFNLAITNTSMPWGAPLYGFTLREVRLSSFNMTHLTLDVFLEFENHSFLNIIGNLNLGVYNENDGFIGSGEGTVNVTSSSKLYGPTKVTIKMEEPLNYTGKGYAEAYFTIPMVNYTIELGRVPYG